MSGGNQPHRIFVNPLLLRNEIVYRAGDLLDMAYYEAAHLWERYHGETFCRVEGNFGTTQRRVTALMKDDLFEMMVHVEKEKPLRAVRYDGGIELLLRRSKTDQEGAGRTIVIPYAKGSRCAVKVLTQWLELAGISEEPLFRQIRRHDKLVGDKALTQQAVAIVVKSRKTLPVTACAGYCTEAATVGLQPYQIREQTGHKSDTTLARYIRPVAKRKTPSLL